MTVLPGSLDYLYYNGVLDHIPYDVYDMPPVTASGMQRSGMGFPPAGSIKQSFLGDTGMNNINYPGNMNGSAYLNEAMKGGMYGNYGNYNDSFNHAASYQQFNGMQPQMQMYGGGYGGGISPYSDNMGLSYQTNINTETYPGVRNAVNYNRHRQEHGVNSIREFVNESVKSSKEGVLGSNSWLKGLAALGLIIATPILIIKGFKKPPVSSTTKNSFWSKVNPKNWNIGASSGNFGQKWSNFWSKVKAKNWYFGKNSDVFGERWHNFWSKVNPKNWNFSKFSTNFKRKWNDFRSKFKTGSRSSSPSSGTSSSGSTKKGFWSKLNPKNWGKKKP